MQFNSPTHPSTAVLSVYLRCMLLQVVDLAQPEIKEPVPLRAGQLKRFPMTGETRETFRCKSDGCSLNVKRKCLCFGMRCSVSLIGVFAFKIITRKTKFVLCRVGEFPEVLNLESFQESFWKYWKFSKIASVAWQ